MSKSRKLYQSHPVNQLIKSRQLSKSDSETLALVVEGGGLRGVVSGAMLAELELLNIGPNIFDFVVGTSAGAFNAAYFLTGQAKQGMQVYLGDLARHKFIRPWRFLYGGSIMDHDILIEHIMEVINPLDWDKLIGSHKLHAVATSLNPGTQGPRILSLPKTKQQAQQFIRASAHIPIIAGKPLRLDGVRLYDGGLTSLLPIAEALELGATHVLALSARDLYAWKAELSPVEQLAASFSNIRWPGIKTTLGKQLRHNVLESKQLQSKRDSSEKPPHILVVDCPSTNNLSLFEMNPSRLGQAALSGRQAIQQVF